MTLTWVTLPLHPINTLHDVHLSLSRASRSLTSSTHRRHCRRCRSKTSRCRSRRFDARCSSRVLYLVNFIPWPINEPSRIEGRRFSTLGVASLGIHRAVSFCLISLSRLIVLIALCELLVFHDVFVRHPFRRMFLADLAPVQLEEDSRRLKYDMTLSFTR